MNKRFFGELLSSFGKPPVIGALGCYGFFMTEDTNASTLLWALPLTLATLPLLPLYILGEGILEEENKKEFETRTKNLSRVTLPKNYAYITKVNGAFFVEPFYTDGEEDPFETEADARLFLQCLHYKEVLSNDTERFETFWIKD